MKNDRGETPRAGDKAIIIHSPYYPKVRNLIVDVLSDPLPISALPENLRQDPIKHELSSQIDSSELRNLLGVFRQGYYSPTQWLLRIPPNEEAKKLFTETSKPKENIT